MVSPVHKPNLRFRAICDMGVLIPSIILAVSQCTNLPEKGTKPTVPYEDLRCIGRQGGSDGNVVRSSSHLFSLRTFFPSRRWSVELMGGLTMHHHQFSLRLKIVALRVLICIWSPLTLEKNCTAQEWIFEGAQHHRANHESGLVTQKWFHDHRFEFQTRFHQSQVVVFLFRWCHSKPGQWNKPRVIGPPFNRVTVLPELLNYRVL